MKDYIEVLVNNNIIKEVNISDAIISNPGDELYNLQKQYGVKISRSNKSDAVYIFKSRSRPILRVGHPISKNQNHLWNFRYNVTVRGSVTKEEVERAIKEYIDRL